MFRECKDKIYNACSPAKLPQPNMTALKECGDLSTLFSESFKACKGKGESGICSCLTNTSLADIHTKLKKCDYSVSIFVSSSYIGKGGPWWFFLICSYCLILANINLTLEWCQEVKRCSQSVQTSFWFLQKIWRWCFECSDSL